MAQEMDFQSLVVPRWRSYELSLQGHGHQVAGVQRVAGRFATFTYFLVLLVFCLMSEGFVGGQPMRLRVGEPQQGNFVATVKGNVPLSVD